ncbi:MAG: GerMN domain-containing protein [Terracidiphilus sp.]|jgi:hypothetical protein
MIPRYQAVLFVVLLVASAVMAVALWQLRERAHQRLIANQDSSPTNAPEVAQAEPATLMVANDADSSLLTQVQSLPLPQDPNARARVILGKLLDLYAAPDAAHPVPGGANSIAQVFLMPAPSQESLNAPATVHPSNSSDSAGPELAVVNLTSSFVSTHPSGLETENLTVFSICGTLHANLPRVTQIRFLVDGKPRTTLAGHADLTRTYLYSDLVSTQVARP